MHLYATQAPVYDCIAFPQTSHLVLHEVQLLLLQVGAEGSVGERQVVAPNHPDTKGGAQDNKHACTAEQVGVLQSWQCSVWHFMNWSWRRVRSHSKQSSR
jgi:hypothetical protein